MKNIAVFASLLKGRRDVGSATPPPGLPTFTLAAIANNDGLTAYLRVTPTPAPTGAGNPTTDYRVELERRNDDDTAWVPEYQEREVSLGQFNITHFNASALDAQDVLQKQKFRVRIRASNADGFSAWTAFQEATTPGDAPGLPTFTIVGRANTFGTGHIDITPTPASTGNAAIGYRVDLQRRNADDTDWESEYQEFDEPLGAFDIQGFHISGTASVSIQQQAKYRVRIRALNRGGLSAYTAYQEVTIPIAAPNVPILELIPLNASIGVFIQPSLLGTFATSYGYEIRRRRNDNTGWGTTRAEVTTTNTFFVLTMEVGTTAIFNTARYQIRVRAKNTAGNSAWTERVEVTPSTTTQTQDPRVPAVSVVGADASIIIQFIDPPDVSGGRSPASFQYQLRRRNAANTRWAAAQTPVSFTTAPVTITQYNASNTISNTRRHQTRIRAVNASGNSDWTAWIETPARG